MKQTHNLRLLAWLMTICMVVSLIPGMAITVFAVGYNNVKLTNITTDGSENITDITVSYDVSGGQTHKYSVLVASEDEFATVTENQTDSNTLGAYGSFPNCGEKNYNNQTSETVTETISAGENNSFNPENDKVYIMVFYGGKWSKDGSSPYSLSSLKAVYDGYVTTADELKTAINNGTTVITLEEDITISETLTINSDITINGNEHSLIRAASYPGKLLSISADVTMNNLTVDGNRPNATATNPSIYLNGTGKILTLNNCILKDHKNSYSYVDGSSDVALMGGAINVWDGTVIANNTTFTNNACLGNNGGGAAIYLSGGGETEKKPTATLKDCSVTENGKGNDVDYTASPTLSANWGKGVNGGTDRISGVFNFENTTITGNTSKSLFEGRMTINLKGSVVIKDNTQNLVPTNRTINNTELTNGAEIVVEGGEGTAVSGSGYSESDVNFFIAKDSTLKVAYDNGSLKLVKNPANELQNDINEAVEGATIELNGDITGVINIPADKNIILDLKGYKISGSDTGITNYGTLTIMDSSGKTGAVIGSRFGVVNYGDLTINSGKIEGTKNDGINNQNDKTDPATNVTINGGTILGGYAAICDYADTNSGVNNGIINLGATLIRTGIGNGYVLTSYGKGVCGTNWVIKDGVKMQNTVPGKWVNATDEDASPQDPIPQVGLVDYANKRFESDGTTNDDGRYTANVNTKDEGDRITTLTHINGDIYYSVEPETYDNIVRLDLLFYAGNSSTDTSDLKDIGFVKANYTDNNDNKQVGVTKIKPVPGNDWTPTDSTEVTFTGVMDLATLTAYNGMQLATSQLNSSYPYLWVRVRECNANNSDNMDGTLYCIGKFDSWLAAARVDDTNAAKADVLTLVDTLGDKFPTESDLSKIALTEKANAVVIPDNTATDDYALANEKANAKLDVISLVAKLAAEINSNDKLSDDEKTALLNNVNDMLNKALEDIDSANDIDTVNLAIAKAQAKSAIIRAVVNAHADINTTGGADKTAVNKAFNTTYNKIDTASNANDIGTAKNNGMADIFLKAYLTSASGNIYVSANSSNYRQIEAGEDDWEGLTDSEKAIVNATLKVANNNEDLTYNDLLAQAARYPISNGGYSSSKKVTISSVKNGKITVDKPYASSGQTVTITVTPNTGYKLDTLTVTDKSGKEVEITDLGNGKYSFIMPSSRPATVKGTFAAIEDDKTDVEDKPVVDDTKCDGGEECPSKHLIDVDTSKWYHEAIDYVVVNDLMVGITSNTFEPDSASSRAMIVTILYRLEGEPEANNAQVFDDVADGMWYTKAISWAAENDIVLGYGNGNYGPNDNVTREQLVAILYRYANYKGYDISAEKDIDSFVYADKVGDWAYEALKWAYNKNIVQGIGNNTLSPNANAQRSEIATMIMRFCENIVK